MGKLSRSSGSRNAASSSLQSETWAEKLPPEVDEEDAPGDSPGHTQEDAHAPTHGTFFGPGDAPPYADGVAGVAYWEARHAWSQQDSYDWYMDPGMVGPVLLQRLPPAREKPELLEVGCGTSGLAAWLHDHGWTNILGIDTSHAAIAKARNAKRHQSKTQLQFLHMDACQLGFPDGCFDAVYEKAVFDTLVTGGQSVARAALFLDEIHRVLRPGGQFILVSHAGVGVRLPWFVFNPSWTWKVEMCKLPKPPPSCLGDADAGEDVRDAIAGTGHSQFFHIYVLTKGTPL